MEELLFWLPPVARAASLQEPDLTNEKGERHEEFSVDE
jgi:hypothetical protein